MECAVICMPKVSVPKATAIPERQAMQLPDQGSTAARSDDIAKRRRAMMSNQYTGSLGIGAPSTSSALGG